MAKSEAKIKRKTTGFCFLLRYVRSTIDLDVTIKDANANAEDVEMLVLFIVAVSTNDSVTFQKKNISEIMHEAEYPGIWISIEAVFYSMVTPLKIDISTGDAIILREIRYRFKFMLKDCTIDIMAYNPESVLAEKRKPLSLGLLSIH